MQLMPTLPLTLVLLFSTAIRCQEDGGVDEGTPSEEGETTTERWGWSAEVDTTTELDTDWTTRSGPEDQETTEETLSIFEFFSNSKDKNKERQGEETTKDEEMKAEQSVVKLSQQIRSVLEGYRQHGVIALPTLPIPDPMPVPDIRKHIAGAPIVFSNNTVYGLSNFTLDHINTDIDKMQVLVTLHIKRLVILGNYSMKSWLSKSSGPYNVTLLDVEASGAAEIEKDADGNLQATNSEMDMTFMEAKVDLQNSTTFQGLLQGVISATGPTLFDAFKPSILKEVNVKIKEQVNAKLKTIGNKLVIPADEISPIDKAVAEGRRYVRENGYDPYKLDEKTLEVSPVHMTVSDFTLYGLSQFYRVGGVGLSMDKGSVKASIHLATKRLYGSCRWNVSFSNIFNREGVSHFTVKQLQVRALVQQSLDVKQPPKLEDLDIFLGPIRIQMDNAENFNFIIEFVVNTMPALIRHIIVDTLEIPVKMKAQEILNKVDVEKILEEMLPELDNMGL